MVIKSIFHPNLFRFNLSFDIEETNQGGTFLIEQRFINISTIEFKCVCFTQLR